MIFIKNENNLLISKLERLVSLLDKYEQGDWAIRFEEAKKMLQDNDLAALDKILSAYGGMGSFNDVYLIPLDSMPLDKQSRKTDNNLLVELRFEIQMLTEEMKNK